MKKIVEIFDPIKDFYAMRKLKKTESIFYVLFPLVLGILFLFFDGCLSTSREFVLDSFTQDLLNQMITMLTLFISFSMAYLSIIITSGSKNVDELKEAESKVYYLRNKKCTLYQVLVNEITYALVIEIIFLMIVLFEKFLIFLLTDTVIKYAIALNIALIIHILIILMITVKDIYYSFWRPQ